MNFPIWVAVLFSFITTFLMVMGAIWVKHLTKESIGFEPLTLSFSSIFVTNTIVLIVGFSWYWKYVSKFDVNLFLIGFFGSIFDCLSYGLASKAVSNYPIGLAFAIEQTISSALLIIYESIRVR